MDSWEVFIQDKYKQTEETVENSFYPKRKWCTEVRKAKKKAKKNFARQVPKKSGISIKR